MRSRHGTPGWHEELFDTAYLRGFTKQIFHSQRVLCTGHAAASDPAQGTQASGYIARYINVVHFAPADLKRQERRLHGYIGKAPPAHDPASRQFDKHYFNPVDFPPPPNGCQAQ